MKRSILAALALCPMLAVPQLALAEQSTHQEHIHADELDQRLDEYDRVLDERIAWLEERIVAKAQEVMAVYQASQEPGESVEVQPPVRGSVSIGFQGDDSDGCDIPSTNIGVEVATTLATVGIDSHARAWTGGNLACSLASNIDVALRVDLGAAILEGGVDRRSVSMQQVLNGTRGVWYGPRQVETAAVSYDASDIFVTEDGSRPFAGIAIGFNVPAEAPRVAYTRDFAQGVSLEVEVQRFPSHGFYGNARLAWSLAMSDNWEVTAHLGASFGLDNIPDPVAWDNDAGDAWAGLAGPPSPSKGHNFGLEVGRKL